MNITSNEFLCNTLMCIESPFSTVDFQMYYYYLFIHNKYELLDSPKLFIYILLFIITTIQEILMHIFSSIFRYSFHVYFIVSYIINPPWKKVFTSIPRTYLLHYTFFKVFLFYLFCFFEKKSLNIHTILFI